MVRTVRLRVSLERCLAELALETHALPTDLQLHLSWIDPQHVPEPSSARYGRP